MTDWTLKRHPRFPGVAGPVVVCIMDGVGAGARDRGDAVFLARTPWLDWLGSSCPGTLLRAHGTAVGMSSDKDMGNSEVGHNAIGAGRVFDQGAKLVDGAVRGGTLFQSPLWKELVGRVLESGQSMHFIGLLSDGNVHSHIDHLLELVRRCDREGVKALRVHALLDGRDVPKTSALVYVDQLEKLLGEISGRADRDYRIASGGGRMSITMDRYGADWEMVRRGWETHVFGRGRPFPSARQAIEAYRSERPGLVDQDIGEFVIVDEQGRPVGPIRDGASVVLFNFRGDRAIELSRAFEEEDFAEFDRGPRPDVLFASMMQYDGDLLIPKRFLVMPPAIDRTLGEYLVHNDVYQLALSETQKFGHVTYFWNGNRGGMFDQSRESYLEVPSDQVPFDQRPWMKSAEITDLMIEQLLGGKVRHARLNYPNGDMVGHTGNLDAAVLAVEAVDLQLGRLLPLFRRLKGALIVTADHGNADEMFEKDKKSKEFLLDDEGQPRAKTSHTLNPVPCMVYAPGLELEMDGSVERPGLSNLAATVLQLLGYLAPPDYDPGLLRL
jgi:2,3-bisphosphoglycerate-independent phosphoglycerate mutase